MYYQEETFPSLGELGKAYPSYRKTFPYDGDYIDAAHRGLAESELREGMLISVENGAALNPQPIKGWIGRPDALKLYEMAYFAKGDILELGSFHGLSTSILAEAVQNAGKDSKIYTVDLLANHISQTALNLKRKGLSKQVQCFCADALSVAKQFVEQEQEFAFVFVDHSHRYQEVLDVCLVAHRLVEPLGFLMFHDFNDLRNSQADEDNYGVYQAIADGLDKTVFRFCGTFGCAGLYQKLQADGLDR